MLKVEAKNQPSLVEGLKRSPEQETRPRDQPKKRGKRWDVTGANGLQFNQNGVFYRGTNRVRPKGKHNHLIDPGKNYGGPVPPAHGGLWTGAYLRNPDDDREDGEAALIVERCRRAADLVAYECLGPPPGGWVGSWAKHLDGDPSNPAPDNLCWATTVTTNTKRHNGIKNLMLSEVVSAQQFNRPSRGGTYRPYRKGEYPDVFAHEQLDAPLRHRMAQTPPNTVPDWDANYHPKEGEHT